MLACELHTARLLLVDATFDALSTLVIPWLERYQDEPIALMITVNLLISL